jgi:hypothetical protein
VVGECFVVELGFAIVLPIALDKSVGNDKKKGLRRALMKSMGINLLLPFAAMVAVFHHYLLSLWA